MSYANGSLRPDPPDQLTKLIEKLLTPEAQAEVLNMTRPEECGTRPSSFSKWVRRNPNLDSKAKDLAISDVDWVIHRYHKPERRHAMMLIEEKSCDREVPWSQRDTLAILSRLLSRTDGAMVNSPALNEELVRVDYFGLHLLRYSDSTLEGSGLVTWDGRPISLPELEELVLFKRDPRDSRKDLDWWDLG